MGKIEVYSEVEAIRRHFQKLCLDKVLMNVRKLKHPEQLRNAVTHKAEDVGFELAKKLMEEIVMTELHFSNVDNGS